MLEMLKVPGNESGLRRQHMDFVMILETTIPYVLNSDGLILSTCLLAGEFPFLQKRFSSVALDRYRQCLVCPSWR